MRSLFGLVAALVLVTPVSAQPLPRVASINMCADQLLVDLADPRQIVGLSPFARDPARSFVARAAQALPVLSGTAEEIIMLRPDLVLSSTFTRSSTHEMVRSQGIRLETLAPVTSLAGARAQILQVARLVGQEARGQARVSALDAALGRLRDAAIRTPMTVLPLARRGWTAGRESLIGDLLARAGLSLADGPDGGGVGRFVALERMVALRPDVLLVTTDAGTAEDQGRAMLDHPVLAALVPRDRQLAMPEMLTICGGPMVVDALDRLAAQLTAMGPDRTRRSGSD